MTTPFRTFMGVLFSLLLLSGAIPEKSHASVATPVVVTESKPLTLVYALESILGFDIRSPLFKKVLCHEGPELEADVSRVEECSRIRFHGLKALDSIRNSLRPAGRPHSKQPRLQAEIILEEIAAQTQDLAVLKRTIEKLSGPEAAKDLMIALEKIDSLAQTDLYPLQSRLQRDAVDRMRMLLTEQRAIEFLQETSKLFGVDWPPTDPIVVALVPVPGKRGTREPTYAHQAGDVVVVEILQDDDFTHRSSVVIHEALHVLWSNRSHTDTVKWEDNCNSSALHSARFACILLTEAIPTALGNGLYRWRATGHLPNDEWYADPILDRYARSILPILRTWLQSGQSLNETFMTEAVQALESVFPSPDRRPDIVFRELSMSAPGDREALRPLLAGVQKSLRPTQLSFVGPVSDPETRKRISAHSSRSALLFASPRDALLLEPYVHLNALEELLGPLEHVKTPTVLTCRHRNGRWYAIVLAETLSEQLAGLKKLKAAQEMPLCGVLD